MNGQALLSKFYLQVDDSSQLSSDEALELINDVYGDLCDERNWSWLQSSFTGTTSTTVNYVALPVDFAYLTTNISNSIGYGYGNLGVPRGGYGGGYMNASYVPSASVSVVFVGSTFSPYRIIDFSQRRNYRDADGYAYIDIPNMRLVFTKQPTSALALEFDYKKVPDDIILTTSPLFRAGFHNILAFGAAARFNLLELTDKNQSYQRENQAMYDSQLEGMRLEDARIHLQIS